jgi:hypothetical protein
VATSFEFRLHDVGPEVLSGLIVHPLEEAPALLRCWRDQFAAFPDETAAWVVLRKAPPLPFLPAEWHGRGVAVVAAIHSGDMREGERVLAPLRAFGDRRRRHRTIIYVDWQQALDPLLTPALIQDFTRSATGCWTPWSRRSASRAECEIALAQLRRHQPYRHKRHRVCRPQRAGGNERPRPLAQTIETSAASPRRALRRSPARTAATTSLYPPGRGQPAQPHGPSWTGWSLRTAMTR